MSTEAALAPEPRQQRPGRLWPSLASSVLLYLSFFPVAWGWLGWVALVPLLFLVRSRARTRRVIGFAFLVGIGFNLPALQWFRVAHVSMYFAWIFLVLLCSFYFLAAIAALRIIDRHCRVPLVVSLPVTWTALEFTRSNLWTGFSWYLLGHTQHDFLEIIQISDLTGAYGVSFLVAAVNGLVFEALYARRWFRGIWQAEEETPSVTRFALLGQALFVLALVGLALWYGCERMRQAAFTVGPRVALLQSNLPQRVRNETDNSAARLVARHNISLCDLAMGMGQGGPPDLIVWPETSYPAYHMDADPAWVSQDLPEVWQERREEAKAFAKDVAGRWRTAVLLGLNSEIYELDGKARPYNSALLIDSLNVRERYDKIHRVPLGEYVPFVEFAPFMKKLSPYDFEYGVAAGRHLSRLAFTTRGGKTYSFGVVICYEDTDPEVARHYGAGPVGTNFLVNISNDGWFDGTSEHEQHLAICRFRAVECRCPVVRSVNMGVSAVIDGNGRVLQPEDRKPTSLGLAAGALDKSTEELFDGIAPRFWDIPWDANELPVGKWREFIKVPGVLAANLPLDHRESYYANQGDWLCWYCWVALAAMMGCAWSRSRR